jgi:hypothetical protein
MASQQFNKASKVKKNITKIFEYENKDKVPVFFTTRL